VARKTATDSISAEEGGDEGRHLTSGDIARLLDVDLKTIHNWVHQGHVVGRRTQGRHLRFDRTEVVRFMRVYGYPVPSAIGATPPKMLVQEPEAGRAAWTRALRKSGQVTTFRTLFECSLAAAAGGYEIVLLDLEQCEPRRVRDLLEALRAWPFTRGLIVVGVSEKSGARRAFLNGGGHVAVAAERAADIQKLARWLTGSEADCPASCEQA
jgi:excisionase family DNA binding protein